MKKKKKTQEKGKKTGSKIYIKYTNYTVHIYI